MTNPVCEVLLTTEPLDNRAKVLPPETGAVVDFWGVVRAMEGEEEISGIHYEAHAVMAEHQLQRITDEATERFSLRLISIYHRTGFVPVGAPSLWVQIGSKHRVEAFQASEWIVSELKKRAPIWKHPVRVEKAIEAPLVHKLESTTSLVRQEAAL